MAPAVRGIAGHRGVGLRVDPVALQALAVRRAHDPARVFEPAVVVCEVDVAGRGICPPAAHHKALGAGVCPPAGLRRVKELGGSRLAVHHPVALQAVTVVAILNGPSRVSRLRGGRGLRNGSDTVCCRCLCRRCLALLLRGDLDIPRCIYALFIRLLLSSRICRGARVRRRAGIHAIGRALYPPLRPAPPPTRLLPMRRSPKRCRSPRPEVGHRHRPRATLLRTLAPSSCSQ